jgi:hypothetical protein
MVSSGSQMLEFAAFSILYYGQLTTINGHCPAVNQSEHIHGNRYNSYTATGRCKGPPGKMNIYSVCSGRIKTYKTHEQIKRKKLDIILTYCYGSFYSSLESFASLNVFA